MIDCNIYIKEIALLDQIPKKVLEFGCCSLETYNLIIKGPARLQVLIPDTTHQSLENQDQSIKQVESDAVLLR